MTTLDELFAQTPAKWVLTTEQISAAAFAIGLTPTIEQVADLCDGHISAIMFHAAAKVGWFGPGIALDGTAENWQNDMGGSCDQCEGVPRYLLSDLDCWDVPSKLLSWSDLRWAIFRRLADEEREDAAEAFGPIPDVADLAWVKQFINVALDSDDIETACGLATITLGEIEAFGAHSVSGYSFTGLDIEFYGATLDEATAVAWRINHLGIVQESEVTDETLHLLDFAALRSDALEHWTKQEAADAAGGNA